MGNQAADHAEGGGEFCEDRTDMKFHTVSADIGDGSFGVEGTELCICFRNRVGEQERNLCTMEEFKL